MDPHAHIVEDDRFMRESIAAVLREASIPTQPFESAEQFIHSFNDELTGCLLLDVQLPGIDGPQLQQLLIERSSTLPVVFLSERASVSLTAETMRAGATDFLEKPFDRDRLIAVVRKAFKINERLREEAEQRRVARRRLLSPREREVLNLFVGGFQTKQIAKRLAISEKTVAAHRARMFVKLGVDNIVEIVHLAANAGEFRPRRPRQQPPPAR